MRTWLSGTAHQGLSLFWIKALVRAWTIGDCFSRAVANIGNPRWAIQTEHGYGYTAVTIADAQKDEMRLKRFQREGNNGDD